MIEAKYGLVSGTNHMVYVDSEWNVDTTANDKRLSFSTEMGPLVVATVMSNLDTTTDKAELKNLAGFTYLSLTDDGSEQRFEPLERPPKDYSQKQLGDIFDALVRRRSFPMRENVYHLGKMSFRKIMFIQYPSDFDLVEKIISEIDVDPRLDEEYVREAYFRSYYDKYNLLHGGTAKGIVKTRASEETISRLNEKIVEVKTRATKRNEVSNVQPKEKTTPKETTDYIDLVKSATRTPVDRSSSMTINGEFTEPEKYEDVILEYVESLENGEIVDPDILSALVEKKGHTPSKVDIDKIILKLSSKIKKGLVGYENTKQKKVVYKRFNKQ